MLFSDMHIFDAHCDTFDKLRDGSGLSDMTLHFNLPAAAQYAKYTQVMAVWTDPDISNDKFTFALCGIERLIKQKGDYSLIKTTSDIKNHHDGVGFILSVEGGNAIMGSLEKLRTLFKKGVRLMTLTWNDANEISDTAMKNSNPGGLTAFGCAVVGEMERLGMAVDVSHISEKGFWDVMELARKPVIASHSCAKALYPHVRNLSDAQFDAIQKNGGIVGVNFYPKFLGGDSVEDIIRHIFHFLSRGGENNIGFGSDFDGIDKTPKEIEGALDMHKILNRLLQENISEEIVRKIACRNMENYFLRVLPG